MADLPGAPSSLATTSPAPPAWTRSPTPRGGSSDLVRALRADLGEPHLLCAALGLGLRREDRQRQSRGLTVRCPRHHGVSCSVTQGPDGGVRVRCFGCGWTADALGLIAEVHGLDVRRDFARVLTLAAQIAGRGDLGRSVRPPRDGASTTGPGPARRRDRVLDPPPYPPRQALLSLWRSCGRCSEDRQVAALLERRGLDPVAVDAGHLARALPPTAPLPAWASFRGDRRRRISWIDSGHRLLLPAFDVQGQMRSVRAWGLEDSRDPKRLPPAGYAARGLVLACDQAVAMLRGLGVAPSVRIVIVEGEPDF